MSHKTAAAVAHTIGIDTGKNTLHLIGLDDQGAIVLREKIARGRIAARLANVPRCLIGVEAGMATHYVARELGALGHDVKQVPPAYSKPFRQGHKNDFRDAHSERFPRQVLYRDCSEYPGMKVATSLLPGIGSSAPLRSSARDASPITFRVAASGFGGIFRHTAAKPCSTMSEQGKPCAGRGEDLLVIVDFRIHALKRKGQRSRQVALRIQPLFRKLDLRSVATDDLTSWRRG